MQLIIYSNGSWTFVRHRPPYQFFFLIPLYLQNISYYYTNTIKHKTIIIILYPWTHDMSIVDLQRAEDHSSRTTDINYYPFKYHPLGSLTFHKSNTIPSPQHLLITFYTVVIYGWHSANTMFEDMDLFFNICSCNI